MLHARRSRFHIAAWIIVLISPLFLHSPGWAKPDSTENCQTLLSASDSSGQQESATYLDENGHLIIADRAFVHGGKKINTDKFRAPRIWAHWKKPFGDSSSFVVIENFLHNGQFYRARIPLNPNAIEAVYIQTMPFPIVPGVMAGHIQARFVFKDTNKIELFTKKHVPVNIEVKDMIVSYEAALPFNESYNFALGAIDANPLVGRMVSGEQKLSEGPDRQFNQYRISLTGAESAELLYYYLKHASEIQMDQFYNTITRNCTTTIFDGLDSLKRFQSSLQAGSLSPFLTTIGGDPVVGPAVNALLARFGDQVEQVQDMKDEYKGVYQSFGTPKRVSNERFAFAPGGKDPMSLLIVTRGLDRLNAEERQVVKTLVAEIKKDLPQTIQMLLSTAYLSADDLSQSSQMISAITDALTKKLNARLSQVATRLPETPVTLQVIFTPFFDSPNATFLTDRGLRAELPIPIQEFDLNSTSNTSFDEKIEQGLMSVDDHAAEGLPAYLKNFSFSANISKAQSQATTQVLLGLQPLSRDVKIENSQVTLSEVQVPSRDEYQSSVWSRLWSQVSGRAMRKPHVSALFTHTQKLGDAGNPLAKITFGAEAIVNEQHTLQMPEVSNSRYICWSGAKVHSPQLLGKLAKSPLGQQGWLKQRLNSLLSGRRVALSIQEIDLNMQKLEISATRIRIGVLGLRCLEIDSVNKQFAGEATAQIQSLIEKIGPADMKLP